MFDNIDPEIWGSVYWDTILGMAAAYPDNPDQFDKDKVVKFISSIIDVAPCEKCRHNFSIHLKKFPLDDDALSSKYKLVSWVVNMKNEVNTILGKPTMNVNDALNRFLKRKINKTPSSFLTQDVKNILAIVLMVILVLAIIFYVHNKKINAPLPSDIISM